MPPNLKQTKEFEALGTKWWITVFDESSDKDLEGVFTELEAFANKFESDYSRFLPDSQISVLNQARSLVNPTASLVSLLTYGKQLYLRTNTHFNLLTGHILDARGYDADYSFTPNGPEALTAGNPVTDLSISDDMIEVAHGNVDIGGFGKGYLIDELAEILQSKYDFKYFLINGGGDLFATSDHDEPIEVYLEHPTKPRHAIHRTTLLSQGFAASSPFKRVWQSNDKTFTHIVTDKNVPRIASFIKSPTARDADAFATAALMINEDELAHLAKTESFTAARFSPATGKLWSMKDF